VFAGVLYGQKQEFGGLIRTRLNIDGAGASRRAIGAANSHPLSVPALRAWPSSGCNRKQARESSRR